MTFKKLDFSTVFLRNDKQMLSPLLPKLIDHTDRSDERGRDIKKDWLVCVGVSTFFLGERCRCRSNPR